MTGSSRVQGDPVARVERLAQDARETVVDVLCHSFRAYPVMDFVLGLEPGREERLRALIGFFTDVRFAMDWPVLGVRVGERLVAAALVNQPHDRTFLNRFEDGLVRIRAELGEESFQRLQRFEKVSEVNEPTESHYFVGMLGVTPEEQGRGHARLLLEHVRAMAQAQGCGGVALSTEDPENLPFYRHIGFELLGEGRVDDLSTWSLWWPTRAADEGSPE